MLRFLGHILIAAAPLAGVFVLGVAAGAHLERRKSVAAPKPDARRTADGIARRERTGRAQTNPWTVN